MQTNWSALWGLRDLVAAIAVGLLSYFVVAYAVVGRAQIMPDADGRILAIHERLQAESSVRDEPFVALLGSSVALEGIDADIVAEQLAGGDRVYNFSFVGGYAPNWLLLAASLAEAKPRKVVMCIDAWSIPQRNAINGERLTAAAWWQLVPPAEFEEFADVLTEGERTRLRQSRLRSLFAFRGFLTDAVEERVRERSRAGLRFEGLKSNFTAPWVHRHRIAESAFDLQLRSHRFSDVWNESEYADNTELIRRLVGYLTRRGITVTFVLSPVHPRLGGDRHDAAVARARDAAARLAKECDVRLLDYADLLSDEDFFDAVHPGERGRITYSHRLGVDLSRAR